MKYRILSDGSIETEDRDEAIRIALKMRANPTPNGSPPAAKEPSEGNGIVAGAAATMTRMLIESKNVSSDEIVSKLKLRDGRAVGPLMRRLRNAVRETGYDPDKSIRKETDGAVDRWVVDREVLKHLSLRD